MTDPTATLSVLYVITMACGTFEDRWTKVVRCMTDKVRADCYVSSMNDRIAEYRGLLLAVDKLMVAWHTLNPNPQGTQDHDSPDCESWRNARHAHQAEVEALLDIATIAEELGDRHEAESIYYSVTETQVMD